MVSPARAALRRMWEHLCTVYEYHPVLLENKTTVHKEVVVIEDAPCRLSFSSLKQANQTETAAQTPQVTKLFIDETLDIKAGSKIVVDCRGREFVFGYSGEAGVFDHHQEIILIPWKGWATNGQNENTN